jgi:hypothetical protein
MAASTCAWTRRIQSAKDGVERALAQGCNGWLAHLASPPVRLEIAQRAVLEHLDLAFGIAELLLAVLEQFAAASIRRERLLERQAATLHVLDNLFKFGKCRFEFQAANGCTCLVGGDGASTGDLGVRLWHGKGSDQTGENSLLVGSRSNEKHTGVYVPSACRGLHHGRTRHGAIALGQAQALPGMPAAPLRWLPKRHGGRIARCRPAERV